MTLRHNRRPNPPPRSDLSDELLDPDGPIAEALLTFPPFASVGASADDCAESLAWLGALDAEGAEFGALLFAGTDDDAWPGSGGDGGWAGGSDAQPREARGPRPLLFLRSGAPGAHRVAPPAAGGEAPR